MNKTVEINGKTYIVEFMEKDTSVDYIKWHNFTLTNMFNVNDYYIIQIVQEKDESPRFYVEYFEKDCFGYPIGEWTYIDEYFDQDNAYNLKALLIDLSDRELRGEFEEEKIYGRERLGRR